MHQIGLEFPVDLCITVSRVWAAKTVKEFQAAVYEAWKGQRRSNHAGPDLVTEKLQDRFGRLDRKFPACSVCPNTPGVIDHMASPLLAQIFADHAFLWPCQDEFVNL